MTHEHPNHKWWTLFAMCFALFMIMLDNTIVNVALPSIQRSLHTSPENLEWTVNSYVLTFAALILLGGKLGDRFGRKRIFLVGLAVFTLSSAACALATSDTQLIAARTVQGMGGALLNPLSLSILVAAFPRQQLSTAIGAWAEVRVGDRIARRELTIGGGHAGGQLGWIHFGLGDATRADVRVLWPGGETGPWLHVTANEFTVVKRGVAEARRWSPRASPGKPRSATWHARCAACLFRTVTRRGCWRARCRAVRSGCGRSRACCGCWWRPASATRMRPGRRTTSTIW